MFSSSHIKHLRVDQTFRSGDLRKMLTKSKYVAVIHISLNGRGYLATSVRNYVESSLNSPHFTAQMLVKNGPTAMSC